MSPVCQFAESERPGVAPGGVTMTFTEASAGVLVPGTNSRSREWLGSSAFANRNEFHTRVMSERHCGTRGWFGEPVNRMLTVTWSRSGSSRHVNAAGPPVMVPSARCSQSNCSRPDIDRARHRIERRPGQRPHDAVVAERWRPRALELPDRLAGLAAELAVHLEQGRHLVRRNRVELLLQLLNRRAGGVAADRRMDRAAERRAPWLALGRALHDAPALARHPRRELVDLGPRLEAADPVRHERRV